MTSLKFGTDGWRAIIGADYTYDNVARCATAVAMNVLAERSDGGEKRVVVGYDTRFSSDLFALKAAETVAQYGIKVFLFDRPAPTPACSFSTRNLKADVGIMITASHNPPQWNGFKVKSSIGGTAPPEQIATIEERIRTGLDEFSRRSGGSVEKFNPLPDYLSQLRTIVDLAKIEQAKHNIVVDIMHGAGANILKTLLGDGVTEIRNTVNPAFPDMKQPEPINENLTPLASRIKSGAGADVGIAFDGDADRLGIVDENGVYMSAGDVFSLLSHHLLERRKESGSIACTITMSSMVDKLAKAYGVTTYRTPIGFKYVAPVMRKNGSFIAGEESGGYALGTHIPDRDGVASALVFLEAMAETNASPTELLKKLHSIVGKHAYHRQDLTIAAQQKPAVAQMLADYQPRELLGMSVTSIDRTDGLKINLTNDGWWLACRLSGTEPLLRIYAEAETRETAEALVSNLREQLQVT